MGEDFGFKGFDIFEVYKVLKNFIFLRSKIIRMKIEKRGIVKDFLEDLFGFWCYEGSCNEYWYMEY